MSLWFKLFRITCWAAGGVLECLEDAPPRLPGGVFWRANCACCCCWWGGGRPKVLDCSFPYMSCMPGAAEPWLEAVDLMLEEDSLGIVPAPDLMCSKGSGGCWTGWTIWTRVAGLVTNLILLCWLFITIKNWCKKLLATNTPSGQLFYMVPYWNIQLPRHTWPCPMSTSFCSPESNIRGWRALFQLKKAVKGPRQRWGNCWGERKRKVCPRQGVPDWPLRQINDFLPLTPPKYLIAYTLLDKKLC